MDQYHPDYRVGAQARYAAVDRRPTRRELEAAEAAAEAAGLWRFDHVV